MTNHFQHFYDYIDTYCDDDRLNDDIMNGNIDDDDPRLQDIESLQEVRDFIEEIYNLAFGHDSINRDWTPDAVIKELTSFSDKALKYDEGEDYDALSDDEKYLQSQKKEKEFEEMMNYDPELDN